MKKVILITLLAISISAVAQIGEDITVCHTPATERFALLASNDAFVASHQLPLAYKHQTQKGKSIQFATADGKQGSAFAYMQPTKSNNYLLVIHEWWGLNDQIKREAEKLYDDLSGVNVIALDLYDGKATADRTEAAKLMKSASQERILAILNGLFDYLGPDAQIGTIGWCFGGGWSLQTALLAADKAKACVIYYGMPEKDVERLKTLRTDVLGIFASQEQWINTKVVEEFADNMRKAGKQLIIKSYDAEHGFANPSNPIYNEAATKDAYANVLTYLRERL
jgi:carboxymethylenebutenolidase